MLTALQGSLHVSSQPRTLLSELQRPDSRLVRLLQHNMSPRSMLKHKCTCTCRRLSRGWLLMVRSSIMALFTPETAALPSLTRSAISKAASSA